jgi:murein DD-endopeptidase MepM/ murein hydrolase activator NlpD
VDADGLDRSFADRRSGNRLHEAIDILAPRHTPVLAVEDGVLVKFFHSKAGGNTIYQFDPNSRYAYYYAHLDRYAAGVKEGDRVKRGQTIGHVGTTGNAPPGTPHLHFAIFKLTDQKQWWKGTPIDPFDVWR